MRTTYGFRGMIALAALVMSGSWASAAILDVPDDYATIQEAIEAAEAGDTIMITDSGTYQTSLWIDKPLIIEAHPGQNPTITNVAGYEITGHTFGSNFTQVAHVDVYTSQPGTRIGSVNGGTINFVHDQVGAGDNTNFPYFLNMHEFTPDVTIENVLVTTIPGDGDKMRIFRDDWDSTFTRVLNLTRFEYDDAQSGADNATEVIRMGNSGLTVNVDESKFYNFGGGLIVQAVETDINITNSVLDARGAARAVYTNSGADITIEDSILIGNSANGVFDPADANTGGAFTISHSVIASTGTRALDMGASSGFTLLVDHSDIIIDDLAGDFEAVRADGGTTRSIVITNSNIVGYNDGSDTATVLVNIVTDPSDLLLTLDHNNYFAEVGWADLLTTYAAAVDSNSQNLDPDYVSVTPIEGDVRYNNATLKTSDDAGEPIGVDDNLLETVPVELSTFEVM